MQKVNKRSYFEINTCKRQRRDVGFNDIVNFEISADFGFRDLFEFCREILDHSGVMVVEALEKDKIDEVDTILATESGQVQPFCCFENGADYLRFQEIFPKKSA